MTFSAGFEVRQLQWQDGPHALLPHQPVDTVVAGACSHHQRKAGLSTAMERQAALGQRMGGCHQAHTALLEQAALVETGSQVGQPAGVRRRVAHQASGTHGASCPTAT